MRNIFNPALFALLAVLLTPFAHAHHSFGMFDDKQCPRIDGTVRKSANGAARAPRYDPKTCRRFSSRLGPIPGISASAT